MPSFPGGRQSTRQRTAQPEMKTIIAKDQIRTIRVPVKEPAPEPLYLPYQEFARLRSNAAVRTKSAIQRERQEEKEVRWIPRYMLLSSRAERYHVSC